MNRIAAILVSVLLLTGCASEIKKESVILTDTGSDNPLSMIQFSRDVTIKLPTRYTRKIYKNTKWRRVGSVSSGHVYQPVNCIFTIEGAHIREAWLVIKDGYLTGFYLPGENAFTELSPNVALPINGGDYDED